MQPTPLSHPARQPQLARDISILLAGVVLLALSARLQVPFWPVPMTLQTMAVMGLGIGFGARHATAMVAGYLAAGLAGLPVFAGPAAGFASFAGPTGGFLVAMLALAWISGQAQGRGAIARVLILLAGTTALYAGGIAWLAAWIPADKLIAQGMMPFLAGDSVKIALVALLPAAAGQFRRAP